MTIKEVTGYRYPEHWYQTFEPCTDNGYGYKLGEYQQLCEDVIVQEMREVKDGKRQPEEHHNTIMATVDNLIARFYGDAESVDDWIEYLREYIWDINSECKGEFE